MRDIDYNVFRHTTKYGLNNFEMPSGKDYLILLNAPIGANVSVKLHNNQGDAIPLKENYYVRARDTRHIYISCDAVEGELIIGQSNSLNGFEIGTAPIINSINRIGEIAKVETLENIENLNKINDFDELLIKKLEIALNPYDLDNCIYQSGNFNNITPTIVLNETIQHDTVEVSLTSAFFPFYTGSSGNAGTMFAYLDDEIVCISNSNISNSGDSQDGTKTAILHNVKGKILKIKCNVNTPERHTFYSLKKYNRKA